MLRSPTLQPTRQRVVLRAARRHTSGSRRGSWSPTENGSGRTRALPVRPRLLVLSTYDSLPRLAEAEQKREPARVELLHVARELCHLDHFGRDGTGDSRRVRQVFGTLTEQGARPLQRS